MSGIAGILRLDGAPAAERAIDCMLATLARRGPDRQRGWSDGHIALGQALLATTPEASVEIQPWTHAGSGCVIVSDSRLDNRPDLLRQLDITGRTVDAIGDAELLHAAWQRWGEDCPKHLLGDFTFAIWDARNCRLFCARDQIGVRPFYYCHLPQRQFAFASEADALLRLPDVPKSINEGRIADFLITQLEGLDKTSTFYEAVLRLPPAHTLTVDTNGMALRRYWMPTDDLPTDLPRSDEQWAEATRTMLAEAVQCRLRSCGQVGSMLSGGLDSSAIVALASAELMGANRGPLPTFSAIDGANPDCAETAAIRKMWELPGLAPIAFDIADANAPWEPLERARLRLLEPFDDHMNLIRVQYLAAQRSGVRGMLDGIDADTIFSENRIVGRMLRNGRLLQAWREARGAARFHRGEFSTWAFLRDDLVVLAVPEWLRSLRRRLLRDRHFRAQIESSLIAPDFAQRIRLSDRLDALAANMRDAPADRVQERSLGIDGVYLTAGIERYGRVAAMHACEPRHPFLDRRLLGFSLALPAEQCQRDGWPKWVLRRAMEGLLTPEVCWRRGKENLGWGINRRVLQRVPPAQLENLPDECASLEPWLDISQLRLRIRRWLQSSDAESGELVCEALAMKDWLRCVSAREMCDGKPS